MADFFTDLFGAFTGQQEVPQQTIIPTNQLIGETIGALTAQAPGIIALNQALAPGLTNVQLGVESQFDPNIAALRAATSRSILDELGLGTSLGRELQEDVIRNALEGTAASGFGVGVGGRGLVARDLGLTGLELARQRRGEALGAVRSSPSLASLFQPERGFGPQEAAGDIRAVQAARDELANVQEDIRRQNFSSLLNTGTRIAGTVLGGIFGGPIGANIGSRAGGSVITGSRVAGQQRSQPSSGPFDFITNLFGGGGSIGGPQFGIGGGRTSFGTTFS